MLWLQAALSQIIGDAPEKILSTLVLVGEPVRSLTQVIQAGPYELAAREGTRQALAKYDVHVPLA